MAHRGRDRRVEPSFDGPSRGRSRDMYVDEEDRVVPSRRRRASAKSDRSRSSRKGRRRRGGFLRLLPRLFYWSLVLGLWAGIAGLGFAAYYGARMPSAVTWTVPDRPPNVKIMSADGFLLANRGMTGGEAVGLHEMSPHIPQAVIAIEDRRFREHFGIDPMGLARAMAENLLHGRVLQGGSTITQQLAKNLFLKPERTIERKVQEVLLAVWLEHKHSKAQILEMYLNRVYFGSGSYGVEAASQRYFGKSARDVTLSEAALLAGLLKAPSRLSPARDPKAAEERAQLVLTAMREEGMIGDREFTTAMSAPAVRAASYWTGSEHYVADRIVEELPGLIGEVRSDLIVETTVDRTLQKIAEGAIRRLIQEHGRKANVSQGALVSIDGSGAVRAMVGGYDYANSQFDRASEARRQPGSAFKTFVFQAALEQGSMPESVRNDAPIRIGKWQPQNYDDKYYGRVTLAEALARSLNSVAAQLVTEVGPAAVVETAWRMGIESDLTPNASIALGTSEVTPLELTAAYVPYANGGYRPDIHFISRITTPSGAVVYEHPQGNSPRVADAVVIGQMNGMLSRTVEAGSARKASFGWPAAGKTGTSQDSRDAWFIGYTANLTTGVWLGNDDSSPMKNVTGGSLATIVWREFMAAAHHGLPVENLPGIWGLPLQPGASAAAPGSHSQQQQVLPGSAGKPIPLPDYAPTASIRRPAAEVGGQARREATILDLILGR
jgi:penicillin-binding protein 1A